MQIARTAALNDSDPKSFCDQMSGSFRTLFDTFDISYTDYVRTTDERHKEAVQEVWVSKLIIFILTVNWRIFSQTVEWWKEYEFGVLPGLLNI